MISDGGTRIPHATQCGKKKRKFLIFFSRDVGRYPLKILNSYESFHQEKKKKYGIKTARRNIINLRDADDTTLVVKAKRN